MTQVANVEQARAWDADEGDHWTEHEDHYNNAVRRYDPYLFAAARISPGDHVLDVGCGCGHSTREAARASAPGRALGMDLSSRMLERARERSRAEGIANVGFERADAQVYPFPRHEFDVVISRFGAMFFTDPVAAFQNIGSAMRPGSRLALLSWQPIGENAWMAEIRSALAAGRDLPEPQPGQPGPFGLADGDAVRRLLQDAGFDDTALEAVQRPLWLGADPVDAFRFVSEMGIARGLLKDLDAAATATSLEALRATLRHHQADGGVVFDSSAWVITAERR